jgi:hypothetical protein
MQARLERVETTLTEIHEQVRRLAGKDGLP